MKNKKVLLSLLALVLVVGVITVSEQLGNRKPSDKAAKFFDGATENTIGSFLIQDSQGSARIQKKGDTWVIANDAQSGEAQPAVDPTQSSPGPKTLLFPADSSAVAIALEKIVSMKKSAAISENPSKQGLYEVDSIKGTFVEVFDISGKSLGSVRIGKEGPDYTSHFVRQIGSNEVYSVPGGVRYTLFSDQKRWRDKTIMKFDRNSAKKITLVKKDGTTIVLAKASDTSSTWSITSPVSGTAKPDQVDELINKLSMFTAADFDDAAPSDDVTGFNQPELIAAVSLTGDVTKRVVIGKSSEATKQFWVKAEGKDYVYLVQDTDILSLDKGVDALKAIDTPPAVPTPLLKN